MGSNASKGRRGDLSSWKIWTNFNDNLWISCAEKGARAERLPLQEDLAIVPVNPERVGAGISVLPQNQHCPILLPLPPPNRPPPHGGL